MGLKWSLLAFVFQITTNGLNEVETVVSPSELERESAATCSLSVSPTGVLKAAAANTQVMVVTLPFYVQNMPKHSLHSS